MITHSREQFLKYLQKLFNLLGPMNLNTEDTTNKSFILHCNINSYPLCKIRTLIKDLVLSNFADFFKSILIYAEVLVKAIKQFLKMAKRKEKLLHLLDNFFYRLPVLFTSDNPYALTRGDNLLCTVQDS